MNEPLVSILIPCYNTKKYLAQCLDTVINQTYKNLEIIIISDGSTDGSDEIIEDYANKDSRIKFIKRENKGVAITRNELIDMASGDFVMFVDSDDTISKFIVEDMVSAVNTENADFVACPANIVHEDTNLEPLLNIRGAEKDIINKTQLVFNLISVGSFYDYPVAKLYSKKSLENVRFPLNRIYEDSATVFKIFCNVERAVILDKAYYNYLVGRADSITTKKYVMKNLNDNYLAIKDRYEFLTQIVPELINEIKCGYIRNILTLLERAILTNDDELINSKIFIDYYNEVPNLYNSIENKNNMRAILNNYKLTCIYLIINGKKEDFFNAIRFVNE